MFRGKEYNQYYKVIRVFVCLYVCLKLKNSGTAGPIWLNLFLLAPHWSGDGFRQKRFWIRSPVFPKIWKNQFPTKIGFSGSSEKPDPEFFCLKPPRDQDGANKKRLSQIGPAVPELLSFRQTYIYTYIQTKTLITL